MTYRFCPTCGAALFWENEGFPGRSMSQFGTRRPKFAASDNRRVGAVTSPVGFLAVRHAAKARNETGINRW